ncbi:MAG: hypothetical protein WAZ18_00380 [Alphaproteobacteria bacterium]
MTVYMIFYHNKVTGDDFIVPMDADTEALALEQLASRYPSAAYQYLTCFEKAELQAILTDTDRWPGVASKPQPTLESMLRRVTSGVGKLPPLPNRPPAQQPTVQVAKATEGYVQAKTGFAKGLNIPLAQTTTAVPKTTASKTSAKAGETQPTSSFMAAANANRSVIDVLRALKS